MQGKLVYEFIAYQLPHKRQLVYCTLLLQENVRKVYRASDSLGRKRRWESQTGPLMGPVRSQQRAGPEPDLS